LVNSISKVILVFGLQLAALVMNTQSVRAFDITFTEQDVRQEVQFGNCTLIARTVYTQSGGNDNRFVVLDVRLQTNELKSFDWYFHSDKLVPPDTDSGYNPAIDALTLNAILTDDCGVALLDAPVRSHVGATFTSATNMYFSVTGMENGVTYTWELKIEAATADAFPSLSAMRTLVDLGIDDKQQALASFIQSRMTHLLNNQPDITSFIDGSSAGGGGPLGSFGLIENERGYTTNFSSSLGRIWAEAERNQAKGMSGSGQQETEPSSFAASTVLPDGLMTAPVVKMPIKNTTGAYASTLTELDAPVQEKIYGSSAGLDASETLTAAQRRGYDMWVQVNGSSADAGDSDSSLWVGYFGAHAFVSPNVLIGALVQADWAEEDNDALGSSADGFGWMVGPYIAAKSRNHNLFFDARAAWGRSDNDLTMPTSTGDFETERWMVNAKLSGLFQSEGWTIRPAVRVSYFEETQESFVDSLTNTIPEQTFSQGEVRFGPTFSYDIEKDDGTIIRPKFGVSGVWNFDVENNLNSQGTVLGSGDVRARVDAGLTAVTVDGWSLDISGYYDGLGIDDYDAWGGKARVSVPLN